MRKNNKKTLLYKILFDKDFPGFIAASIVLFIAYKFMKVDTLDISLFVSVFTLFVCNILGRLIYNLYSNNKEDSIKLSTDYDGICKRYKEEPLLSYNRNVKFPIIVLVKRKLKDKPFDIIMDHKNAANVYSLPEQIENRSEWLLDAHRCSYDYDSRTVRLDNLTHKDNKIILTYSNTTYWDLLRTNRAMDYEWENRKTNRNVYEPGPFISPLEFSLMVNHIGFNGFIEFHEIGILFVGRSNKMSVGKKTWGTSISAKLSPKYDYKKGEHFTLDGFYDSIAESINRELKYFRVNGQPINVTAKQINGSIFAFYRDLVEGGKTQFLLYHKFGNEKLDVKFNKDGYESSLKQDKSSAMIDGTKYAFLTIDQLKQAYITQDEMFISGLKKKYKMTPSAVASVVLLLEAMGKERGIR